MVAPINARSRPIPHETLWYEDGNIVLVTNAHLYRVHKGILVQQSSVFNAMLRMPLPDEGDSKSPTDAWKSNVLPMVNMEGDKDEDVYNLLMAVYDRK